MAQVVKEGGAYANGQVVVQPLPTAIYGEDAQRTVPLRRLEAVLTEEQLDFQCELEMQKVQLSHVLTSTCVHVLPFCIGVTHNWLSLNLQTRTFDHLQYLISSLICVETPLTHAAFVCKQAMVGHMLHLLACMSPRLSPLLCNSFTCKTPTQRVHPSLSQSLCSP